MGSVTCIGDMAVGWTSQRQPVVALSSTEAEYVAISTGVPTKWSAQPSPERWKLRRGAGGSGASHNHYRRQGRYQTDSLGGAWTWPDMSE